MTQGDLFVRSLLHCQITTMAQSIAVEVKFMLTRDMDSAV